MSPLGVRRYRAERLLRHEFRALRGRVLGSARAKLRAAGVSVEECDLEAAYAAAWQGLYAVVLEGQEIVNPGGWLALATFRRALDEHRARERAGRLVRAHEERDAHVRRAAGDGWSAEERDLASALDDRTTLRQLFEAMCVRLSAREREAAVLCYLQGLSRAEAAARMGVSEARMRKLMEGCGRGRLGVAGKVAQLVQTIREGAWCEEQGSLMRAFTYGILDPDGERYGVALMHQQQCPACRAYVASLRGLAVALPPVLLPGGLAAEALAHLGAGSGAGAAGLRAGGALGPRPGGVSGGALPVSGAAGASASGAAGGGWLLAGGSFSAKLAAGCLLALGVGAGCIAIEAGHPAQRPEHRDVRAHAPARALRASAQEASAGTGAAAGGSDANAAPAGAPAPLSAARRASREFGPEQAAAFGARAAGRAASKQPRASAAAASVEVPPSPSGSSSGSSASASSGGGPTGGGSAGGDSAAAEREFSPG
jgi:DNA-directed RNA polymerase specialized sigma24 family protein